MSTVAKIFVVLNLVFALIYAGVAATLLQKNEHWKFNYEKEKLAHADTKKNLDDKITVLTEKNNSLVKEVDDWRNRYDALQTQNEALKNENSGIEKKWNEMKTNYDSLVEKYDALSQDLDKVQRQKDELQQQLNNAIAERDDAIHMRDQSVDDLQRRQKELEDVKIDLGDMKKRHVSLAKKKAELEWLIAQVQEKVGVEVFQGLIAPPKIDGAVIGVSNKVNLVVVNVGEEDGMKVGFELTIYRGSSYVGKMVIEKVYPRQAAGRVITAMTKDKPQVGDRVSTQVY